MEEAMPANACHCPCPSFSIFLAFPLLLHVLVLSCNEVHFGGLSLPVILFAARFEARYDGMPW